LGTILCLVLGLILAIGLNRIQKKLESSEKSKDNFLSMVLMFSEEFIFILPLLVYWLFT